MINVDDDFKTAMKKPIKELEGYINVDDNTKITSSDDLISFKVSCDTGLCKTAMKKIEIKVLGEHNLLSKWVYVGFGVKVADGTFKYLDYGSFLITETTTIKDTGVTTLIGYDKMILTMTEYSKLEIDYPITLYEYTKKLCEICGLELENETFTNADWQITEDLWENINGITYRDIFVQIAQVTASTCIINSNGKVHFKYLTPTNEKLKYENMFKFKIEPVFGEINSVVLSRTPAEDNLYLRDEESILANGLTEFKIENNEIIDKNRESAITPIFNALDGIKYYPFEITTEGLGWYEIADNFDIETNTGDVFTTSLFNYNVTIDGGIKEVLKTVADTKTQTQYQYATSLEKRISNTEIITNKQDNEIKAIVEQQDVDSLRLNTLEMDLDSTELRIEQVDDDKNQQIETLRQQVSGLTNIVSQAGGNNIFYYDKDFWTNENEEKANLEEYTDTEIKQESISSVGYMINKGISEQKVSLKNDNYTISFTYKKLIDLATGYILVNGTQYDLTKNKWEELVININIDTTVLDLQIVSDTDNAFEIFDLMGNIGTEKQIWTQNPNETRTDTVIIGKGIQVNSNVMNTYTRLDADGNRTFNKSTNKVIREDTDKGSKATNLEVDETAKISGMFFQEMDDQTWLSRLN